MSRILTITDKNEMRAAVAALRREGKTVGLVPTMGALHAGHLSLVTEACARCDVVAVSIFVNPTQFAPGEDFARYPRQLEADTAMLEGQGVEMLFAPSTQVMYAADAQTVVMPGQLASRWEGAVRPGHFSGVATVVAKLLNIVQPDLAFFGEKDFQQLKVVERLNADLDLGCTIVGCPIIREPDGLAMSSRNVYLTPAERIAALALPAALGEAVRMADAGEREVVVIERAMHDAVRGADAHVAIDYAAVVDAATLEPLARLDAPARAIIAARVGATRLIDNVAIAPAGVEPVRSARA